MIGIIGAMEIETAALKAMLHDKKDELFSGTQFCSGTIDGRETVIAQSAEGKVNSAVAAQTMILKYSPDFIINTGVAGGLHPKIGITDIAVSTGVVQYDFDISPLGYAPAFVPRLDTVVLPADEALCNALYECALMLDGTKVFKGVVATGDRFVNDNSLKRSLWNDYAAICVEMEGASIGHVCALNNTPFCVLRAISDSADNSSHMDFGAFTAAASEKTVKILSSFITKM